MSIFACSVGKGSDPFCLTDGQIASIEAITTFIAITTLVSATLLYMAQNGYISHLSAFAITIPTGVIYGVYAFGGAVLAANGAALLTLFLKNRSGKVEVPIEKTSLNASRTPTPSRKAIEANQEAYVKVAAVSIAREKEQPLVFSFPQAEGKIDFYLYSDQKLEHHLIESNQEKAFLDRYCASHFYVTPEFLADRPLAGNERTFLQNKKGSLRTKTAMTEWVNLAGVGLEEKQFVVVPIIDHYAALTIRHEDKKVKQRSQAHQREESRYEENFAGFFSRWNSRLLQKKIDELKAQDYIEVKSTV